MAFLYVIDNMIDGTTLCCTSSEDTLYIDDYLYNARPSKPFRFTGVGSVGSPEWICVESLNSGGMLVTFAGIFNHNLVLSAVGDELRLKACDEVCEGSGACDWDNPDREWDLSGRVIANFRNVYQVLGRTYPSWRFDFIDQNNADGYVEIGDAVLGQFSTFSNSVHLQPGRSDGPQFFAGDQETEYGQDWPINFSTNEELGISFVNLSNPTVVDELDTFIRSVRANDGKVIIVPDDALNFCYYCVVKNLDGFASREAYSPTGIAQRSWRFDLKTLTEGITLL